MRWADALGGCVERMRWVDALGERMRWADALGERIHLADASDYVLVNSVNPFR